MDNLDAQELIGLKEKSPEVSVFRGHLQILCNLIDYYSSILNILETFEV
jgi:hypothetical protein